MAPQRKGHADVVLSGAPGNVMLTAGLGLKGFSSLKVSMILG